MGDFREWTLARPLRALDKALRRYVDPSWRAAAPLSDGLSSLTVKELTSALNGGYSAVVEPRLVELFRGGELTKPDARSIAMALLNHYIACNRHNDALAIAEEALQKIKGMDGSRPFLSGYLAALIRTERWSKAQEVSAAALLTFPDDTVFEYIRSRLEQEGDAALDLLNRCYARHGLAPLALRDSAKPLALTNIECLVSPSMAQGPKISVVIPSFNAADTIGIAIESLLAQSHRDIEIIVVDDCSADRTFDVAKEYAEKDSRVRVAQSACNSGPYVCQNIGLHAATGEFIRSHGADDWSHPQSLELQLHQALSGEAELTISMAASVSMDLKPTPLAGSSQFLVRNMSALLLPRQFLVEIGGWDPVRFSADGELLSRLETVHGKMPTMVMKDLPLALLLTSESSLTGNAVTGRRSLRFGARWEYRDTYLSWHKAVSVGVEKREKHAARRDFPAPLIMSPQRPSAQDLDVVIVSDFHTSDISALHMDILGTFSKSFAVSHWPRLHSCQLPFDEAIRTLLRRGGTRVIVPGERVRAKTVIATDPQSLLHVPDAVPLISCEKGFVLVENGINANEEDVISKNFELSFGVRPQRSTFRNIKSAFGAGR